MKQVRCRQAFKAWKLLEGATEALPKVCSTVFPLPLLPLYHHRHLLQSSGEDRPGWQALVWPGRESNKVKLPLEIKQFISSSSMLGAHRPPSPLTGLEYSQVRVPLIAHFCQHANSNIET